MLLSLSLAPQKEFFTCAVPKTMEEILKEIVSRISVKTEGITDQSIYISETKPPPDKKSSVWIKTSFPVGIGIIADGVWAIDYGMSGFNRGQIFLFNFQAAQGIIPGGVRLLNETEIADFGLTDTDNNKANRLRWAIFEPQEITV